jgi:hypothetical protein
MAATPLCIIESQELLAAWTTYYTSASVRTRIDKLTFCNFDNAAHTVSVSLVPSGGAQGNANLSTAAKVLQPGETWNSPNEVSQVLNAGDLISINVDTASKVVVRGSGTQLS